MNNRAYYGFKTYNDIIPIFIWIYEYVFAEVYIFHSAPPPKKKKIYLIFGRLGKKCDEKLKKIRGKR